jgi:hypothetical protein
VKQDYFDKAVIPGNRKILREFLLKNCSNTTEISRTIFDINCGVDMVGAEVYQAYKDLPEKYRISVVIDVLGVILEVMNNHDQK